MPAIYPPREQSVNVPVSLFLVLVAVTSMASAYGAGWLVGLAGAGVRGQVLAGIVVWSLVLAISGIAGSK